MVSDGADQNGLPGEPRDAAAALVTALERLDLRGGRWEHAWRVPEGVDLLLVPPAGSNGSPIFVTAAEGEIHIAAGAGGRRTVNNEDDDDIDHFLAVIAALIDGGGQDLVSHDPVHGYQPRLAIHGRGFSSGPPDAALLRQIPAW